jgi:hypothetical protein
MLSMTPISTTTWKQLDTSAHYAVDLPGADASVSLGYFVGKQNVFGQYALVEEV